MWKLIVLEVPGLTMDLVQRGDCAAHLSDLIAQGDLLEIDRGPIRCLAWAPGGLAAVLPEVEWMLDESIVTAVAERDAVRGLAAIDEKIGLLRCRAEVAVVSESVLITPRPVGERLSPGKKIAPDDVPFYLKRLADGR